MRYLRCYQYCIGGRKHFRGEEARAAAGEECTYSAIDPNQVLPNEILPDYVDDFPEDKDIADDGEEHVSRTIDDHE